MDASSSEDGGSMPLDDWAVSDGSMDDRSEDDASASLFEPELLRGEALSAYRNSRAARSFVVPRANTNARRVMFRQHSYPIDCEPDLLMVEDQSGAEVPAADFYEWVRQQYCELCALRKVVDEHVPAFDDPFETFFGTVQDLVMTDSWGSRGPFPPELLELLFVFDDTFLSKIVSSQRYRHDRREVVLREVLGQRLSVVDPLNVIVSFLEVDDEMFLPRAELPVVLEHLVESFNARTDTLDEQSVVVRVYSGEHGPLAKGRRLYNGIAGKSRWQVFWEGGRGGYGILGRRSRGCCRLPICRSS